MTFPWEPEPATFSQNISDVLVRAGWSSNPNHSENSIMSPFSGLAVKIREKAEPKDREAGVALVESLTSEGITAKLELGDIAVKPIAIAIEISVGTKR